MLAVETARHEREPNEVDRQECDNGGCVNFQVKDHIRSHSASFQRAHFSVTLYPAPTGRRSGPRHAAANSLASIMTNVWPRG